MGGRQFRSRNGQRVEQSGTDVPACGPPDFIVARTGRDPGNQDPDSSRLPRRGLAEGRAATQLSLTHLRPAQSADVPALQDLIVRSARALSAPYYTHAQTC